ncbi:MAG: hypothetical protein ACT6RD_03295 [Brevundimonas sp.]|uniref:hypothetical protein n=1 Tax=Brevundimonas sp. TaxID=1871086 RepID=UPI0040339CF9
MAAAILLGLSLLGLGLLALNGGRYEKIAAVAFIAYLVVVPLAATIRIENWRIGVAVLEVVLFVLLWWLAERSDRWWLTAAAGFQLIAVLSFSIPFIAPGTLVLTGVAARFGAWVLITICFFVGVVEVRARRRASIGSCQNGVL